MVLIWGMWLCFKIRNAPPAYNESKFISWAIYNAMFATSFLMVVRLVLNFCFRDILGGGGSGGEEMPFKEKCLFSKRL